MKIQKVEHHLETLQQSSPRPTRSGNASNPAEERLLQHFIFYTKHYEDIHRRLFRPTQEESREVISNAYANQIGTVENHQANPEANVEPIYDAVHESHSDDSTHTFTSIEPEDRRHQNSILGSALSSPFNQ